MVIESTVWKCECGYKEYTEYPPEECKECWKISSFSKTLEEPKEKDIVDEMEELE